MKYSIAFRRSDSLGVEEYDGGNTLAEARREGGFFASHLPEWVNVRICKVSSIGRLETVEYVKRS